MRYLRLLVGVLIIGATLWVIVGEQMSGASANAFVNAQLTTVRAQIAGTLSLPGRPLGSFIERGDEVGTISDPRVESGHLNDLMMEKALATTNLVAADARLMDAANAIDPLADRMSTFADARIAEFEARLTRARDRLSTVEAGAQTDTEISNLAAGVQLGEGADPRLPDLALAYARERVEVLEIALEAARNGVFLGDGYNDAPYSEQRRTEMESIRDVLSVDRDMAAARVVAIEDRIEQEQLRTNILGRAVLPSPATGLIWDALAADGETVQRGQDLLKIVDCQSVVVSVSVTESIYNSLRIGDAAVFRLTGDGRSFPATVSRLAGSGARAVYQNLAVAPSQKHLERYDVALLVPELRTDPTLYCLVGRTGRVFFDRRPLDALRELLR